MRQLWVEADVGCIQQRILARLIVRGDHMEISVAQRIRLSKHANKVTDTVCPDSNFLNLMRTVLISATMFEKD